MFLPREQQRNLRSPLNIRTILQLYAEAQVS